MMEDLGGSGCTETGRKKGDRGERKDDGWIFWVYTPALPLSPTVWPQAGHLTSLGLSPPY